jgi:hypothetical protein
MPSSDPDVDAALSRVRRVARLLDSTFTLPGTRLRFGWDALVGLIPGADLLTAVPALYILFEARRHRLPLNVLLLMSANILIDTLAGSVPIIGDAFDFAFKANERNLRLFERGQQIKRIESGSPQQEEHR